MKIELTDTHFNSLMFADIDKIIEEKCTPYYAIIDIKMIVPNKVMKVFFADKTSVKLVCSEPDTFDLRMGCFIALAKKFYSKTYTIEGIEHKAKELSYEKKYDNIVNKAIKNYNKKLKLVEQEKAKIEEEKLIKERQNKKREERINRRNEKAKQELINELAEAISLAMKNN